MRITIKCPHCRESIKLDIKGNGQVEVCGIHDIEISEGEIKEFLSNKGIELG